jgi:predicted DNA-binding protein (MmcQ/YjbR family)
VAPDTVVSGFSRTRIMSVETIRKICRSFPGVTEDVKWGNDLVFSVGGKMFAVIDLEPPHSVAFKCTNESFGELIERTGIIPAPYLARAMWVQETEFGETLELRELTALIRTAYEIVAAKLPKARRPGVVPPANKGKARKRNVTR